MTISVQCYSCRRFIPTPADERTQDSCPKCGVGWPVTLLMIEDGQEEMA